MPAVQEGRLGLYHGYNSGDSGWGNQVSNNFIVLGTMAQIGIVSRALTAAPASPVNGACYIPASGATGVWAGKSGQIATYRTDVIGGGWQFIVPPPGAQAVILDEGTWGTLSTYKAGAWSPGTTLS